MATKKKLVSKAKAPAKKTVAKKAPAKKTAKSAPKKVVAKAKLTKKVVVKAKPVVKKVVKVAAKKAVAKKVASKKVVKPIVKKSTKPALKKVAAKKIAKAKPVVKKAVKVAPKKLAKATKNVAKFVVKKVAPKKNIVTPVAKKVASSTLATKTKAIEVKEVASAAPTVKVKAVKPTKPAKVVPVKKPMVAPTTFSNPRVQEVAKNSKEPKGKFEMEFVIRASEDMVFEYVSTESGLSEWFCDDVNIKDSVFTFNWDGQIQEASLVKEIPPLLIRFQWLDKNDGSYFEFRTQKDDLTNDVSLIITDFADSKADEESARLLWHSQIDKLLHVLGSYF